MQSNFIVSYWTKVLNGFGLVNNEWNRTWKKVNWYKLNNTKVICDIVLYSLLYGRHTTIKNLPWKVAKAMYECNYLESVQEVS